MELSLGQHLLRRRPDPVLPFLDLQYLYGLARAGHLGEARARLQALHHHAEQATGPLRPAWQQVAVHAAEALLAHAEGQYERSAQGLGQALPRLSEIGGSHAQRDLFAQIHLDALRQSGQWVGAQNLLQPLCNQQPESRRLAALARQLYRDLGLAELGASGGAEPG